MHAGVDINDDQIHLTQATVQDAKRFATRIRTNQAMAGSFRGERDQFGRTWISINDQENIRFHINQVRAAVGELSPSLAISCA